MGEVTGRLTPHPKRQWILTALSGTQVPGTRLGVFYWFFARRIDAIAFARRKGIRLQEER